MSGFNVRMSSGAMSGLQGLFFNAFQSATQSASYQPIAAPSFTVDKITSIMGAAAAGASQVILTVASGGIAPAWARPGAAVNVNVTYQARALVYSSVIREVSSDGKTITFVFNPLSENTLSVPLAAVSLDAIAGSVVNNITLNVQAQRVIFSLPTGSAANVTIAPAVDAAGANPPWSHLITVGDPDYAVDAPVGSKINIADWYAKSASVTPALQIRFI